MTLTATVADPLTEPAPPGWDAFVTARRARPGWFSGPLRAIDWCVQVPSAMVVVTESGGAAPVALFHSRHFGPGHPGRYVRPGHFPRVSFAECRTAPVPMEAGLSFADGTETADRIEAVRVFEQALRRRARGGQTGIVYRNLLAGHLPVIPTEDRRVRALPPRMVLVNQWSDLPGYLASLPPKWRSQLKKIHEGVDADPTVEVSLGDRVDPSEACWLAEVNRLRYTPRLPPLPPLSARAIAAIAEVPGVGFLTYRGPDGRLLGYSAYHDNGDDLHLIWWGTRGETDGWRSNLYFDQYLRVIDLMIATGRRRLVLGGGMTRIKERYGAVPEPLWTVLGVALPLGRGRRRRPMGAPAGEDSPRPAPAGGSSPSAAPAAGDAPAAGTDSGRGVLGGPLRGRLRSWLGPSPGRSALATECRQCGEWVSVNVLSARERHVRYWCERCGASVTLRGSDARTSLRPVRDLPAAARAGDAPSGDARAGEAAPPGTLPDGPAPDPYLVMPPAMVRWAQSRFRRHARADQYERSVFFQRYRQWDAHLRTLGPAGAAGLAEPGEPAPCPGLPPFSQVVGALHDGCYRVDAVVERLRSNLRAPGVPAEVAEAALVERVEHARRWLARHDRSRCWVHSRLPDGGLAVPDRSQVEVALKALLAGTAPDPAATRAAKTALFGADGGPALSTVLQVYSREEVINGLRAYLTSGARPLRVDVLAHLSQP